MAEASDLKGCSDPVEKDGCCAPHVIVCLLSAERLSVKVGRVRTGFLKTAQTTYTASATGNERIKDRHTRDGVGGQEFAFRRAAEGMSLPQGRAIPHMHELRQPRQRHLSVGISYGPPVDLRIRLRPRIPELRTLNPSVTIH